MMMLKLSWIVVQIRTPELPQLIFAFVLYSEARMKPQPFNPPDEYPQKERKKNAHFSSSLHL